MLNSLVNVGILNVIKECGIFGCKDLGYVPGPFALPLAVGALGGVFIAPQMLNLFRQFKDNLSGNNNAQIDGLELEAVNNNNGFELEEGDLEALFKETANLR